MKILKFNENIEDNNIVDIDKVNKAINFFEDNGEYLNLINLFAILTFDSNIKCENFINNQNKLNVDYIRSIIGRDRDIFIKKLNTFCIIYDRVMYVMDGLPTPTEIEDFLYKIRNMDDMDIHIRLTSISKDTFKYYISIFKANGDINLIEYINIFKELNRLANIFKDSSVEVEDGIDLEFKITK